MRKWILLILLVVATITIAGPVSATMGLAQSPGYDPSIAPAAIGAIALGIVGIARWRYRRR